LQYLFLKVRKFVNMIDPALMTPIKFVRQYKTRKVVYDVEFHTVSSSQAIRDAYGSFWRQRSGRRLPDGLKGISFANATTFSTRVRVRLLKEVSRHHQALNPSVSCYVTNYLSRPELKVRERRGPLNSYTYSQTIQKFPQHLTLDFLRDLYLYAKTNLPEREVVERFLILTPDLFDVPLAQPEQVPMAVDEAPVQDIPPVQSPAVSAVTVAPTSASPSTSAITSPGANLQTTPQPFPGAGFTVSTPSTLQLASGVTQGQPQAGTPTPFEIANLGANDDFIVVQKRNRNRFTKKATPYPAP
jgi:hypothetical protein